MKLSKLRIIDQIETAPQLFYKKWWESAIRLFTTKTWQILALISIWLSLLFWLLKWFANYKKRYFLTFLNTLALILLCIAYFSYHENYNKTEAIIFSSSVSVNSAPTNNSTNLLSLNPGTKVEIIDKIEDWLNIKITNGNSGWIKESDCKILD